MVKLVLAALTLALGLPTAAPAQVDGVDPLEIARQVRRNMLNVEESLNEIENKSAAAAARSIPEDLDKLIKGNRRRGIQITKDIDALISTFRR